MKWTDQAELSYRKTRNNHSSHLTFIYPVLKQQTFFSPNMSVLSIGGGEGALELAIMRDFNAVMSFIDPCQQTNQMFERSVREADIADQLVEIYQGRFEDFPNDQQFDLVISIHSWQYLGYESTTLQKAIELLSDNGVICVVLTSEKSFTKEVKDALNPQHNFINYEEFQRWAEDLNYNVKSQYAEKIVPLTRYLIDDDFTEYAQNIFAMLARTPWEKISREIKEKVRSIILRFQQSDRIDDGWGLCVLRRKDNKDMCYGS